MSMEIIGSYISPYVRKVLACLELKGIDYTVDPITPFFGSDEFEQLSPLRRIPVMIDGDVVITDSSVICAYLDEAYPDVAIMPESPPDRARVRWLEEFADSRLGDVFIWDYFYQMHVHPRVWNEPGDQARIDRALAEKIPAALDYLETQIADDGWLVGDFGLADISIASFFRNADLCDFQLDADRWSRTARFIAAAYAHPVFERLYEIEKVQWSVPIAERRDALIAIGARVSEKTYGLAKPRQGIMRL